MVIKGVISVMAKLFSVVALKALKCILSDPTHLPQHSVPFDLSYCQLLQFISLFFIFFWRTLLEY